MQIPSRQIFEISQMSRPLDVAAYWRKNSRIFNEYKYIQAFSGPIISTSIPSLSFKFPLGELANVKSLFNGETLYFYDKDIVENINMPRHLVKEIGYTFILDTNAASYIKGLIHNKTHNKSVSVLNFAKFIKSEDLFFDYIYYIIENYELFKNKPDVIKENIKCLEILRTLNTDLFLTTGELKSALSDTKLNTSVESEIEKTFKSDKFDIAMKYMYRIHAVNYLLLLLMIVHERKEVPLKEKIRAIVDFMHSKLSCIFERELVLSIEFMTVSFGCGFFNKVNRGAKSVLDKLKNMAWDMTLLRYVEEVTKSTTADFIIPFIVSYDDELLKLFDIYPVKALLINKSDRMSYTRPEKDIIGLLRNTFEDKELEHYFTEQSVKDRQSRLNDELDLKAFIEPLEQEVLALYP